VSIGPYLQFAHPIHALLKLLLLLLLLHCLQLPLLMQVAACQCVLGVLLAKRTAAPAGSTQLQWQLQKTATQQSGQQTLQKQAQLQLRMASHRALPAAGDKAG
jgi:hypothetical protein